jgi:arabinan endo-1,5-alpha-L-arabinosidase
MTTVRLASLLTVTAAVFAVAAGITAPTAAAAPAEPTAPPAASEPGAPSAAPKTPSATQAPATTADSPASKTPPATSDPAAAAAAADPDGTLKLGKLRGDVAAHDPALVKGGNGKDWYVFSTGDAKVGGGTIQIRSSKNGRDWTLAGTVWDKIPGWLTEMVPGTSYLWAPEIHQHGGTYYLYYSASTWGHNNSVIALATNTTLDPSDPNYKWVDQGKVVRSVPASDFNAIDAGIVEDAAGTPWLAFGSYWSGIRMVKLQWPSGKRADKVVPLRIADRKRAPNAIEAATIVPHDGWYYLFTSWGQCCEGANSDYKIVVGRSRDVTGPYVDKDGDSLLDGGGSVLQKTSGDRVGPGGQSWSDGVIAYHYYDAAADGATKLSLKQMRWGEKGWPELNAAKSQ